MAPTNSNHQQAMGLDVGTQRIGVAVAHLSARFPRPLTTLSRPESFIDDILNLCHDEDIGMIVLGRPRSLEGQSTAQTELVANFADRLAAQLAFAGRDIPLYWIDEALTSTKAEAELESRGKPYQKADIDALAATYILDDYLQTM